MNRGQFIVLEGTDGVGKTTLAHNLIDTFKSIYPDKKFEYIANPNPKAKLYKAIRNMLKDPNTDPDVLQYAMGQNYMDLVKQIREKLFGGINIILDRWVISAYVYNRVANGSLWKDFMRTSKFYSTNILDTKFIDYRDETVEYLDFQKIDNIFTSYLPTKVYPDVVIGLDMPLNVILEHSRARIKEGAKEVNDINQDLIIKHYNLYNEVFDTIRQEDSLDDKKTLQANFGTDIFKYIYLRNETKSEAELYTLQFKEAIEAITPLFNL